MGKDKANGVTIRKWNGHRFYRWRVFFPDGSKRLYKGFRKKTGQGGAEEFAEAKRDEIVSHGVESANISTKERLAVMTFREKAKELEEVGEVVTLQDVIKEWADRQNVEMKREKISVMLDKYSTYLDTKPNRKGELLSEDHKRTIRNRLEAFREDYGDWASSAFTKDILKDWLDNLRQVEKRPKGKGSWGQRGKRTSKGKKLGARTRNHFRSDLSGFFDFLVDETAALSNPVADIKKKGVADSEIGILSAGDAESLLRACDDDIVAAVAIGLFAGLRRAEIIRADWEDVDFEEVDFENGKHGEITVPYSAATKNKFTREVPISPNLKSWLEPYRRVSGKIVQSEGIYRNRIEKAVKKAGIDFPHNALRHSFASYHYGFHKKKTELREQLGHEPRSKTLEKYYQRKTSRKQAEYFWNIAPVIRDEIVNLKTG